MTSCIPVGNVTLHRAEHNFRTWRPDCQQLDTNTNSGRAKDTYIVCNPDLGSLFEKLNFKEMKCFKLQRSANETGNVKISVW